MKKWRVNFYYRGHPSYKGEIFLYADNESVARKLLSIMVESENSQLPDNWDDVTFTEEDIE